MILQIAGKDHAGRRLNARYKGWLLHDPGEQAWAIHHFTETLGAKGSVGICVFSGVGDDRPTSKEANTFAIPAAECRARVWVQESGKEAEEVSMQMAAQKINAGAVKFVYPVAHGKRWIPKEELSALN